MPCAATTQEKSLSSFCPPENKVRASFGGAWFVRKYVCWARDISLVTVSHKPQDACIRVLVYFCISEAAPHPQGNRHNTAFLTSCYKKLGFTVTVYGQKEPLRSHSLASCTAQRSKGPCTVSPSVPLLHVPSAPPGRAAWHPHHSGTENSGTDDGTTWGEAGPRISVSLCSAGSSFKGKK